MFTEPSHPFSVDTLCRMRALAVLPAVGLTLLGGCGGTEKRPDVRADIPSKAPPCAEGSIPRVGSSRGGCGAVVRAQAGVSRRPRARPLGRLSTPKVDGV